MSRRRHRPGAVLAVVVALLTGCSGRPAPGDVEPAMTQAVRAVVGDGATVHRELVASCGPSDEPLDGQRLELVAEVPPGSVDLSEVVDELRRSGSDVRVGDGTHAPLVTVESDHGWTAELWPSAEGPWRVTASADVDGTPDDAARPCG